jgi:hypothetical protein
MRSRHDAGKVFASVLVLPPFNAARRETLQQTALYALTKLAYIRARIIIHVTASLAASVEHLATLLRARGSFARNDVSSRVPHGHSRLSTI